MNLFRVILYAGIVVGVVGTWELLRDDIKPIIEKVSHEQKNNSETDVQAEKTVVPQKDEPVEDKVVEAVQEKIVKDSESNQEENNLVSFEKGFEKVAKKAMHSVVNVATMQLVESDDSMGIPEMFKGGPFDDLLKEFFDAPSSKKKTKRANALGSGFIVKIDKQKAYIVTNNHVVDKAKKVIVFLSDKTELPAEIHAVDSRTDIAVLSVELKDMGVDLNKIQAVEWGNSDALNEGNFVVAIGNPFGFGSTVTHGIVSAKGRSIAQAKTSLSFIDDFIQHSAPINMGNSGGCLLDVHGKVIGINNAIFSTSGGNIGIGFAIPSNIAKVTVDQLIEHKRTFRGWLGAEVHQVNAKQAESVGLAKKTIDTFKVFGAFVARVVPNGPAEKSGIKVGDIIIEFNGKQISEKCSLQSAVGSAKIGSSVKAKVWRQNDGENWKAVELDVKVGDFEKAMEDGTIDAKKDENGKDSNKAEENINSLGVSVSNIPNQIKDQYPLDVKVVITKVDEAKETMFEGPLFLPGDGIISANNKKVTSVSMFKQIMSELETDPANKGKPIPFVVIRNGSRMMIATTIDIVEKKIEKKKEKINKKK